MLYTCENLGLGSNLSQTFLSIMLICGIILTLRVKGMSGSEPNHAWRKKIYRPVKLFCFNKTAKLTQMSSFLIRFPSEIMVEYFSIIKRYISGGVVVLIPMMTMILCYSLWIWSSLLISRKYNMCNVVWNICYISEINGTKSHSAILITAGLWQNFINLYGIFLYSFKCYASFIASSLISLLWIVNFTIFY